jgi:hypothetical protein
MTQTPDEYNFAAAPQPNAQMQEQGLAAITAWRQAFRVGDFQRLCAMASPSIEFRFGIAPYNTLRNGQSEFLAAIEFLRGLIIRVEQHAVTPPLFNASTVAFEFRVEGTVGGQGVQANFLVLFTFDAGRIVSLREYGLPAG